MVSALSHEWQGEFANSPLIYTIGYEARSRFVASALRSNSSTPTLACPVNRRRTLSFESNLAWAVAQGFTIVEQTESSLAAGFRAITTHLAECDRDRDGRLRVVVDVSSMSRVRLASVLSAIARVCAFGPVTVRFLYAPVAFSEPPEDVAPVSIFEAVGPDFAAIEQEWDLPLTLLIGLGYEPDRALGAHEYLEPDETWIFLPTGTDHRFDDALIRTNSHILSLVDPVRQFAYSLAEPGEIWRLIYSITSGALNRSRVALVPFGPKLFTLASLLVAFSFPGRVSVLRVSAGEGEATEDHEASGSVVGFDVEFSSKRAEPRR